MIEWVSLSDGGNVIEVDPATKTLTTDFESYKADVANVIPPQRAGRIAIAAGITDRTGWCPVDPVTFESQLVPDVHVIGDAAIAGAMPKAASAANEAGKICAAAIACCLRVISRSRGSRQQLLQFDRTRLRARDCRQVPAARRPIHRNRRHDRRRAPSTQRMAARAQEAKSADAWFAATTGEIFG
jgi:hypothetical protein